MRSILIAVSAISLAIAAFGRPSLPRAMKDMPIPPDTFGYRTVSTGWADLLSRDKTILVRRDSDSILTVRDARTDTIIFGMWRPAHWITCYAIGPDDDAVATGSRDGKVEIWDAHSGTCNDVLRPRLRAINWIYFLWENYSLRLCAAQLERDADWDCFPANNMWADSTVPSANTFTAFEVAPTPLPGNPRPVPYGDGVRGKVYVQAYVDEHGNVMRWHIARALPPGLGFEAEAARLIRQWKFTPAIQQGRPIGVWIMVPFTFELK